MAIKKIIRTDNQDPPHNIIHFYTGMEEVRKDATRFYHETFDGEDDYNENWEADTNEKAINLFEGNDYTLYRFYEIRTKIKKVKAS